MLQMAGGNFPLTADVNFGANFGLLAKYFETRSSNPATTGTVRLASADAGVVWRNNAHNGNLALTTDSSDQLLYNGSPIATTSGAVTSITGTANQITASAATGAVTLSTPQNIATSSSPTFAGLTLSSPLSVANGGTGDASLTAYAVLAGGTSSTNPIQSVASVGSAGQVLTSNGAGALPTFQNTTGSGTVNSGTAGQLAYYATSSATISGASFLSLSTPVLTFQAASGQSQFDINSGASNNAVLQLMSNSLSNRLTSTTAGDLNITDVDNSRTILAYTRSGPGISTSMPLAMGSNKITGLANGTAAQDAAAFSQLAVNSAGSVSGSTADGANTITTRTITTTGGKVLIVATTSAQSNTTTNPLTISAYVTRGGTSIVGGFSFAKYVTSGALTVVMPVSIAVIDSPTAGTYTYRFTYDTNASGGVLSLFGYSLQVIELHA